MYIHKNIRGQCLIPKCTMGTLIDRLRYKIKYSKTKKHEGDTPIHDAIATRNDTILETLLKHHQEDNRLDLTLCNNNCLNCLNYAVLRENIKLVFLIHKYVNL